MKKLFATLAVLMIVALLAANLSIAGFAAPSPEATTYSAVKGGTAIGDENKVKGSSGSGDDALPSGNYNYWDRTTKSASNGKGDYENNDGKDDPNSPNYTGDRSVSTDRSTASPDTAAEQPNAVAVAATLVLLLSAAFAAVIVSKKTAAEK